QKARCDSTRSNPAERLDQVRIVLKKASARSDGLPAWAGKQVHVNLHITAARDHAATRTAQLQRCAAETHCEARKWAGAIGRAGRHGAKSPAHCSTTLGPGQLLSCTVSRLSVILRAQSQSRVARASEISWRLRTLMLSLTRYTDDSSRRRSSFAVSNCAMRSRRVHICQTISAVCVVTAVSSRKTMAAGSSSSTRASCVFGVTSSSAGCPMGVRKKPPLSSATSMNQLAQRLEFLPVSGL